MNILIADDESIIRLGLQRILEDAGHIVYAAADGREALQLAETRTPDLAILDIKMPGMDGLEAARELLARAQVPIIFLTAFGEQELVERAARMQVMGYLIKPIKEAELLAMIRVASARFQEHARTAQTAAELQSEVATKRVIDRAKGLLMQREGISELEAYNRLQAKARAQRLTLEEVAAQVNAEQTER